MIVKNESAVIQRCLDSVIPLIDYWVIVDTGSTDDTKEIIREHLKNIPGELHERPWRNFGENRTEALELAKGKGDFLLFMDADDTLEFPEGFRFSGLTKDLYNMWRGIKNFTYIKPQLVRANLPWKWIGVTHEYLGCALEHTSETLETVKYISGDGGHRSQDLKKKFLNNIELLQAGLEKEPDNVRYLFYLAESYKDGGFKNEALQTYIKRVKLGGWEEEIFWSLLQIAHLHKELGSPIEKIIECFNLAHRARPHRAEPIYFLAELYNQKREPLLAYECIKGFLSLPKPKIKDVLFNLDWINDCGLSLQLSFAAVNLGLFQESIDLCDNLLTNHDLDEELRSQIETTRAFSIKKLQPTPWEHIEAAKKMIEEGMPFEAIVETYQKAHELFPNHAEPLFFLSRYYKDTHKYQEAYNTIQKLVGMKKPDDVSEGMEWIYDYGIRWDYSLYAYSVGNYLEAAEIGKSILEDTILSEADKKNLEKNINLYYYPCHLIMTLAKEKWGTPPWETQNNQKNSSSVVKKSNSYKFQKPVKTPKLHICTMATHETQGLNQLIDSCKTRNLLPVVKGLGEIFAFGKKLQKYKEFVDGIEDHDIVLCLDAYDTLVLADEKTMIDKFLSMNAPCVVSVEIPCHPFPHLRSHFPPSPTKFQFVNSGGFIGYAGYLKHLFAEMSPIPDEADDQGLLSIYYLYHPNEFKLDYQCELFLSLANVASNEIQIHEDKKTIECMPTSSFPCVIHGNGMGKPLYQNIYNIIFKNKSQNM